MNQVSYNCHTPMQRSLTFSCHLMHAHLPEKSTRSLCTMELIALDRFIITLVSMCSDKQWSILLCIYLFTRFILILYGTSVHTDSFVVSFSHWHWDLSTMSTIWYLLLLSLGSFLCGSILRQRNINKPAHLTIRDLWVLVFFLIENRVRAMLLVWN